MNTEKICRCCLALDVPLLSIYNGDSAGMGCVADMLKQIAKLKPQPADKMPKKACLQCISEINRCYVFKMKCENSNRTLRQLLPDAVPEPLDTIPKKVLVTSSAVQTEDKILVSSQVQTVEEEIPLISLNSVETIGEERPLVNNKEIKTEYRTTNTKADKLKKYTKTNENIFIYEEIENSTKEVNKRTHPSPVSNVKKKLCLNSNQSENLIMVEESESTVQQPNSYILYEDTNVDSNGLEDAEIFISNSLEKQKDPESNHYEYFEDEVEEYHDDESKNIIYQENDESNENLNTNNEFEIDSSESMTKTPEATVTSEQSVKTTTCTRLSKKPKGQYKCPQCEVTFVSIKVLKRHLANRHDIKDADLLIDYLLDETSTGSNEPSSTGKLCNTNIELTSENVAKPQLLPREKVSTSANGEMLTNIKYFCDYCQAGFAQRKTLTSHMKHQVCMTNNFKCNICERIFVSEENLKTHKLTHEYSHKCLECDTVCKTIEELSQHMIDNHNRSARNQCHVCKKVFTMKASLMDHLRIHSGEKPFVCTICSKSFSQSSNLRQHLIRHTNEKNFKCDMCPNAYVTKAELNSHKRTHTGDHPFKCNICHTCFTTSCSLQKHLRKHTGERPYACEFCPMRFAALNVLKNHRRIHTGEKPFKCAYCSKCFTQKGDCQMHQRTHINKEFKCFCESKFTKKSNLRQHIKTQHPGLNEKEIHAVLEKSVGDNDDTESHITLMENSEEKLIDSPSNSGNTENDCSETVVTISEGKANSNNNEEYLEIVMEDVG